MDTDYTIKVNPFLVGPFNGHSNPIVVVFKCTLTYCSLFSYSMDLSIYLWLIEVAPSALKFIIIFRGTHAITMGNDDTFNGH